MPSEKGAPPKRRCPDCAGVLVPTTLEGVTRCDNWPGCRYMAGLEEFRASPARRRRCTHRSTQLVMRFERWRVLEAKSVCEECGGEVALPKDIVIDYRKGYVRVMRVTP